MCGIIALLLADQSQNCRQDIYDGLTVLQHRGQDAAGIVTTSLTNSNNPRYNIHKDQGYVKDVFTEPVMDRLRGYSGLGHCRYPTAGTMSSHEAQPMYINYPCGLALGHNGNLTNDEELSQWCKKQHRHLNTKSDSEVLLNVFGEFLRIEIDSRSGDRSQKITPEMIMQSVKNTMAKCRGGYSVVLLVHDVGVVAFRDPFGIRPLVFGVRESTTLDGGVDYCMASESVVFDILGFTLVRDVQPGECMICLPMIPGQPRENKGLYCERLMTKYTTPLGKEIQIKGAHPCLFEYVYLARPDSVIDGVSVHHARLNMGIKLAEKIKRVFLSEGKSVDIDAVIPVPETSRPTALACATALGISYSEGFVKNRYIARTFIMSGQAERNRSIRLKLNTIRSEFKNRNVLLVDDSLVRGNTSKKLLQLAHEAGAQKVYFASAAPQIAYPNVYGIDLPTRSELTAYGRTDDEIAKIIGADKVFYQDLADLELSVREARITGNADEIEGFDGSPFTCRYLTEDIDEKYFTRMEQLRNDAAKQKELV